MSFPCFHQRQGRDIALAALPPAIVRELADVCREAWHGGMLAGCNGNASCRWQSPEGERIVITRSGAAKGRLTLQDLCVLDARSGATLYGGSSSSEGLMHLEVYAARPRCGAILHTHPRQLLALALKLEGQADWQERFLKLPVFESGVWRARLGYAPAFEPGTRELAEAVGQAARDFEAVWMTRHGLCATAPCLGQALTLSEELEHLAAIQLLAGLC